MPQDHDFELRQHLEQLLEGKQAHLNFASAVRDFPPAQAGLKPDHAPHSAWELLEHLRITQRDILDFSRGSNYKPLNWPADYWPKTNAPSDQTSWQQSVDSFEKDLNALKELAADPHRNLYEPLPHGEGQTLLRELLLVADHNSHHLGQFLFLKKMLSA